MIIYACGLYPENLQAYFYFVIVRWISLYFTCHNLLSWIIHL